VPALIERLREKQVSWSVTSLARAAGELCLEEADYEAKTRRLIAKERSYLSGAIAQELGWRVWPGEANFLLVRCPAQITAAELQELLGRRGILIRSCAMYPGLTPGDFRIAVRTRPENDRLLTALRDVWRERRERR
jgi:threonine-phosphate decarboxylase